jgi:hypothetical protein
VIQVLVIPMNHEAAITTVHVVAGTGSEMGNNRSEMAIVEEGSDDPLSLRARTVFNIPLASRVVEVCTITAVANSDNNSCWVREFAC